MSALTGLPFALPMGNEDTSTDPSASFTMLLPMLAACFVAMVVPTMIGEAPIYDALREDGDQEK